LSCPARFPSGSGPSAKVSQNAGAEPGADANTHPLDESAAGSVNDFPVGAAVVAGADEEEAPGFIAFVMLNVGLVVLRTKWSVDRL